MAALISHTTDKPLQNTKKAINHDVNVFMFIRKRKMIAYHTASRVK
jgi:hypothetical protein